jgi:ATP-binding cassette, subfamily A (ABC1), member 3
MLAKQVGVLVKKNLLILVIRRPISILIRAFLFPLLIVFLLAYAKKFFDSPEHFGVGAEIPVSDVQMGFSYLATLISNTVGSTRARCPQT